MSQNKTLRNILEAVCRMAGRKRRANARRPDGEKYAELQRVRLGSRLPAYLPMRVNDELVEILREFREKASAVGVKQFIIQTHFQTPLEVTPEAEEAIRKILSAGWLITNQLVYTVAASRRGHTTRLRQVLNSLGVVCYYTFSVKGFQENYAVFTPNSRSMQEQQEEKLFGRMTAEQTAELDAALTGEGDTAGRIRRFMKKHRLPFLATDRSVLNLPAIGKSTFVRREVLGLSALGMNAIIPGDLKPDYASLVNMLGGQVIRLGAGIGVVNPLDPGDLHYALQRLEGKARKDLTDYYNDTRAALMEVLLTIMRTGREADDVGGARGVTARESDILSVAVRVLHDRHGGDPQPPVIADLRDLLREGPDEVRMAAVWDDPENDELYRAQVRGLLADLHGFSNRMTKFGRLFGDQTTARIDLSRPVDFDISALAQSGDDVVAAVLATTWTSAFAAKNAADVLAEEGLQPRRNHVIIMDEMHRALRASPLMVEKLDLLTRLNRQWGVGQIMITHTFKDLMCMETPAQNTKARGFVERSEIKVLGALSRIEVDRYLRGECGLPVSRREEDMLEDWATPVNFGSDASHKGLGRFLIKLGGLPGIPINVEMCPLEKSGFNDTNLKWHA